jgi:hypothetical protein
MAISSLYFSFIKRNQNYGVMVFVKHYLSVEFFEYDFVDSNIVEPLIKYTIYIFNQW